MFKKLLQSKTIEETSPKRSKFILRQSEKYLEQLDGELRLKIFSHQQDFIIRWKKNQLLEHVEKGQKKTHLLARSFKGKVTCLDGKQNKVFVFSSQRWD